MYPMRTFVRTLEHSRHLVVALALLPIHPATADINYTNFNNAAGLVLVGQAAIDHEVVRLTPASMNTEGAIWYEIMQSVGSGFQTDFEFRISETTEIPADGFSFVIQNSGSSALGFGGSGMGYSGIGPCLAIEFDTYHHTTIVEMQAPHISVQHGGDWLDEFSLGATTGLKNIMDGTTHTARISYTPNTLSVYLDNLHGAPVLTVDLDISQYVPLQRGAAWVGFTAGTGGFYEKHDILSWSFRQGAPPVSPQILGCRYDPDLEMSSLRFSDTGATYYINLGNSLANPEAVILVDPTHGNVDKSVPGETFFQFLDSPLRPLRFMWISIE